MKTTIKDIKAHAKAIKESGYNNYACWMRLDKYLIEFDNVEEKEQGMLVVWIRGCWREIFGEIIKSTYFYE